jgi:Niemann-Pick C1 protein
MTMLIGIIVIDERRVDANHRDILCCISARNKITETPIHDKEPSALDSYLDQWMVRYSNFLLQPVVKAVVLVLFVVVFAVCTWSATLLKQEFTVELVLPQGSYVVSFLDSLEAYTSIGGFETSLIFRDIDQSTPESQQAMETYLNDMVALKEISSQPDHFWLRDFQVFSKNNSAMDGLAFEEQITTFLELPAYSSLYSKDIARNDQGQVTASRVLVRFDNLDSSDVKGQINMLDNQERVAREQPVNTGLSGEDWAFFSFDDIYFIWSFFKACPQELTITTILGVVAVTLISILAIPHWSAVFFSAPIVMVVYVDLLGFLQFFGATINSISYITLTVSIGLMVDFLIHILLRYFESNESTR